MSTKYVYLLFGFVLSLNTAFSAEAQTAREEARRLSQNLRENSNCPIPRSKINIAHRGNESEYMENSLPAFASAAELRANFVELDVLLTKDNQVLVFHDAELTRSSIINCGEHQGKKVRDLTASEIQQSCRFQDNIYFRPSSSETPRPEDLSLLQGSSLNPRTPPLLSDVMEIVSPSRTGLLVEIKTQPGVSYADILKVLDTLMAMDPEKKCESNMPSRPDRNNSYNCFENIQIMSFDIHLMDYIDQQIKNNPKYHRMYRSRLLKLVYPSNEYVGRLINPEYQNQYWNLDGVAFGYRIGENSSYDEARLDELLGKIRCENDFSKNKLLYVWTAHSLTEIDSLKTKNLDGIIHSRPRDFYPRVELPRSRGASRAGTP